MRAQVKSIGTASSGSVDSIAFGQQIFTRTGYYRVRSASLQELLGLRIVRTLKLEVPT